MPMLSRAAAALLTTAIATGVAAQSSYSGTWSITPPISYTCGFGTFQLTVNQLSIVDTYPTLTVTLRPTFGGGALGGTFASPTTANATQVWPGSCTVTGSIALQFTGANTLTGTLNFGFSGSGCGITNCTNQMWTFTGVRQWPASYATFGGGCASGLGLAHLGATTLPRVGTTLVLALDHLPANAAFLATGWSNSSSPLGPLPLDLGGLGMTGGCFARVSPDAVVLVLGAGNVAAWSMPIPNLPVLLGATFYQQAVVPAPGVNAFGAVVSDAAAATVGM